MVFCIYLVHVHKLEFLGRDLIGMWLIVDVAAVNGYLKAY